MRSSIPFRFGAVPALLLMAGQIMAQPPAQKDPDSKQKEQGQVQKKDQGHDQNKDQAQGYLGALIGRDDQGAAGVMIGDVAPDSQAAKAGLRSGDRIVKLGDQQIQDDDKFLEAIEHKKAGEKLALVVMRDNKEQNFTVTLGDRPAQAHHAIEGQQGRPVLLGVHMIDLTPDLQQRLNMDPAVWGALITDVIPNSPAAKAGLRRDDV